MSYEVLLVINHKQIAILFPICGEEPFLFHSFFRLLLLFFSFFASLQLAVIKASVYANDGFMAEKSLRSATELRPTRATTFRGGCGGRKWNLSTITMYTRTPTPTTKRASVTGYWWLWPPPKHCG